MLELGDGRHGSTKRFRVRDAVPRSNLQQLLHLTGVNDEAGQVPGKRIRAWRRAEHCVPEPGVLKEHPQAGDLICLHLLFAVRQVLPAVHIVR